MREHHRPEGRERSADRTLGPPFQPREELYVGRREAVPDFFDLGHVLAAEFRQRLFGKPRGHADAKAAGDELDQRVAAGGIHAVEPALDQCRAVASRGGVQRFHDLGQARHRRFGVAARPSERDRLGEVADIIVGIAEQHLVHARDDEAAKHRRLDACDREIAGDRGDGVAAVGIGRGRR